MPRTEPQRSRRRLLTAVIVVLMVPAFALALARGWRSWNQRSAMAAVFGPVVAAPARSLQVRLSHPALARHQPYREDCPEPDCRRTFTHAALARLERLGDLRALATAYALAGEGERALALLDLLDPGADTESDRAAVLSTMPGHTDQALQATDRALLRQADHPQAIWNRAVLLEKLGLARAAASAYRRVRESAERGWGAEARVRAGALDEQRQAIDQAYQRASSEAQQISRGVMPSAQVIASHPDVVRLHFMVAARESPSPALLQALAPIARALDTASGSTSLVRLLGQDQLLRQFPLLRKQGTLDGAREYARLADTTGDPWLLTRAHQTLGEALLHARQGDQAVAAFERAVALCEQNGFPQLCIENKTWLAHLENGRRHIQKAKRWAGQAMRDARSSAMPAWEAQAVVQLAVSEDFREHFSLARAYAEEASFAPDCVSSSTAREILAKIALAEGRHDEARDGLEGIAVCPGTGNRFGLFGLEALVNLASDPTRPWPEGRAMLDRELALHQKWKGASQINGMALRLFEARANLRQDRERARLALERIVTETYMGPARDQLSDMIRIEAVSALAVESGLRGDFVDALDRLEQSQGLRQARPCILGVVVLGGNQVEVARTASGAVVGRTRMVQRRSREQTEVAPETISALAGCPEVRVVATAPVLGQSRLLPPQIAWSYLQTHDEAPPVPALLRRLVVHDARPPAELGLPRLLATPSLQPASPGETVETLQGAQATREAVLGRARSVDLLELHVHGLVDPEVSDAAALVLSAPTVGGRTEDALLTATDLLSVRLPRRPGVILGACRAGLSAHYGAYRWSLPLTFINAGARWVMASPTPMEDAEAPAFFRAVWHRIATGTSPATALRDERQQARWQTSYRNWTKDVVIFQ